MMWWLALTCFSVFAQDMPFFGTTGKTSISAEYASTEGGVDLTESRLQAAVPIVKREKSTWGLFTRGHHVHLGETLTIGDRAYDIPKDFGSAEIGLGASFPSETVSRGINASIGTTGRQLFNKDNARVVSLTYYSEWKSSTPGASWYFFLSYSNNRTFLNNIPLPGFAYGLNREGLRLMAGLPFVFLTWMPRPWLLTASVSPFSSSADVGYIVQGPWQLMTALSWHPRSFQNLAPNVDGERLMFDKKEWATGARVAFGPLHSATLAYVYQFDRRFFIGESLYERESDAANLADSGGIQFKMRTSF